MGENPARDLCSKELPTLGRTGVAKAVPGTAPFPSWVLPLGVSRADHATHLGAAALQEGETVAPQNGAGGGGTACCRQGTHRSGHPTPPLYLSPRAHTYCITTLLVFNTVAADTSAHGRVLDWVIFKATSNTNPSVTDSVYLLVLALPVGQQQFKFFCTLSSNTKKSI